MFYKVNPGMVGQIVEAFPNFTLLLLGGFAGATTKMVLAPHEHWRAWLVQIFVGLMAALFIGGAVASYLDLNLQGIAAVGFVVGSAGELFMRMVQRRLAAQLSLEEEADKSDGGGDGPKD